LVGTTCDLTENALENYWFVYLLIYFKGY